MATDQVKTSERLWSEEVGIANAEEEFKPLDPGYEWSNGKVHYTPKDPYA